MSYEILLNRYKELKKNYDTVVNCNDVNKRYLKLRKQYMKLKEEYKQSIQKLNEIIEKDRQFYKYRMDDLVNLKQGNEQLKAKLEIGKTCGFCPYYDYKSRCEKAINSIDILQEIIYQQPTDNKADDMWLLDKLDGFKNILNGSDEK